MEPDSRFAGVTSVRGSVPDDSLAGLELLYEASYARLVATIRAVSGVPADEAEEAVQDAFLRLIGCWQRISGYEDPEAWLRKVALGYASNRRRKALNGIRALWRQPRPSDRAESSADGVDVERALKALPLKQRQVIVLVHLMGLDVKAAARVLGIPEGTVKSRLARGRMALAVLLSEGANDLV